MKKLSLLVVLVLVALFVPACVFSRVEFGVTGWPPSVNIALETKTTPPPPTSQPSPAPESKPSAPETP